MPFSLAHLSDLHIGPLPPVGWRALAGKRLLGYLSWRIRRVHEHRPEALDALQRDLEACRPDHVAITGDLVNIALPAEFAQAARWLAALGPPERVSAVPGNHDAYVAIDQRMAWAPLAGYMAGDRLPSEAAEIGFPYLRFRGPLALVGLSTAVPSGPGFAIGRLGATQLEALEGLLAEIDPCEHCRVILLHHPPLEGITSRRKRLVDAEGLRRVLAARGAELVLHGHAHVPVSGQLPGPNEPIPVQGVASSSSWSATAEHGAPYRIYGIDRAGDGWRIEARDRLPRRYVGLGSGGPVAVEGRR